MIRVGSILAFLGALWLGACAQSAREPSEVDFEEPNGGHAGADVGGSGSDASATSEEHPSDWATREDGPVELHPQAEVFEAGELEWAPGDREVVLHTYAESEATRDQWKRLREKLAAASDDIETQGRILEEYAFGLAFDVGLRAKSDPDLKEFSGDLAALSGRETVFTGIGGPFARHRFHLFECGPGASEEDAVPRMWLVGDFAVQCRFPELRYGVVSTPDGDDTDVIIRETYLYEDEEVYKLFIVDEPPIPDPYLSWWRDLRDRILGAWERANVKLPEQEYWSKIGFFIHFDAASAGAKGVYSERVITVRSDIYKEEEKEAGPERLWAKGKTWTKAWHVYRAPVIRSQGDEFWKESNYPKNEQ